MEPVGRGSSTKEGAEIELRIDAKPVRLGAALRTYPDASYRDVTAPNADTLYTYAYLDLSTEPWVVSTPDLKGRYGSIASAQKFALAVR